MRDRQIDNNVTNTHTCGLASRIAIPCPARCSDLTKSSVTRRARPVVITNHRSKLTVVCIALLRNSLVQSTLLLVGALNKKNI